MPRFASPRGADDQAATCGRASRCPRPAALSIDLTGCSGAGRPRDGCRAAVWLPSCAIGHAGRAGVGDPQRFLRGRAGAHPAVKHRAPSAVAPAGSSSPPSGAGPIARAAPQIAEHPGPRGPGRSAFGRLRRRSRRPASSSPQLAHEQAVEGHDQPAHAVLEWPRAPNRGGGRNATITRSPVRTPPRSRRRGRPRGALHHVDDRVGARAASGPVLYGAPGGLAAQVPHAAARGSQRPSRPAIREPSPRGARAHGSAPGRSRVDHMLVTVSLQRPSPR